MECCGEYWYLDLGEKKYQEAQNNHKTNNSITCTFYEILFSVAKSRRMRWVGHITCTEEKNVFSILVTKPEGKIPLGKIINKITYLIIVIKQQQQQ
jgi:hypothetical protein